MLGIVIVDYKGSNRTVKFIKEEISKISIPYKLVIVLNSYDCDALQMFKEQLRCDIINSHTSSPSYDKDLFIIPSTENLGFAKGNNLGAEFLISNFYCENILFSNNDIILKQNNVVEELLKQIEKHPEIGMIGPEVIGNDGKRQSPEPFISMPDRHIWMYALTPFLSAQKKQKKFKLNYSKDATEGYHFRIMGSFFIMPTKILKSIGMMDPNTFLYAEEMILSKRLEKNGSKVYFYPEVSVIHDHGATTNKYLDISRKRKIQLESEKYYYTQYCGVSKFKASLIVLISNIIFNLHRLIKQ